MGFFYLFFFMFFNLYLKLTEKWGCKLQLAYKENSSPAKERWLKSTTYKNIEITKTYQMKSEILPSANLKITNITHSRYLNSSNISKGNINQAY